MGACRRFVKKIRNLLGGCLCRELIEHFDHAVDQLHRALAFLLFLFLRGGQFGGFALLQFLIGRGRCFGRTAARGAEQGIAFEGTDSDLAGLPVEPPDQVFRGFQGLECGLRTCVLCVHMGCGCHCRAGEQQGCQKPAGYRVHENLPVSSVLNDVFRHHYNRDVTKS